MNEGCGAALSDGAGLEAVADSEIGATCDLFPDEKNGSAVEAVADEVAAGVGARNDGH